MFLARGRLLASTLYFRTAERRRYGSAPVFDEPSGPRRVAPIDRKIGAPSGGRRVLEFHDEARACWIAGEVCLHDR